MVLGRQLVRAAQSALTCKNTHLLAPADTCCYRQNVGKMWARIVGQEDPFSVFDGIVSESELSQYCPGIQQTSELRF